MVEEWNPGSQILGIWMGGTENHVKWILALRTIALLSVLPSSASWTLGLFSYSRMMAAIVAPSTLFLTPVSKTSKEGRARYVFSCLRKVLPRMSPIITPTNIVFQTWATSSPILDQCLKKVGEMTVTGLGWLGSRPGAGVGFSLSRDKMIFVLYLNQFGLWQ